MEMYPNGKFTSNPLIVLESLVVFDVWLLIKAHWIMRKIVQILFPTLKMVLVMMLGAGLLLAYAVAQSGIRLDPKVVHCKNDNLVISNYLEINDNFTSDPVSLRKDLLKMKKEAMNLEKSLYRMRSHLKSLHNRQRNLDMNLADFASEAIGGFVVDTPDTQSYYKPQSAQLTLFGLPIWKPNYHTPRKIIQPWTQPGECWAFRGSHGKIEIQLAHAVIVDKISLEHITASASITGNIDSAPKSFVVLGEVGNQFVKMGTFAYNNQGLPSQIFDVTEPEMKHTPIKRIILEILSNWGNPDYTCIYRFKVHGKMYYNSIDETNMKVQ